MRQYTISSGVTMPANFVLDGHWNGLLPLGNSGRLTSTLPSAAATTTASSGFAVGERSVIVASASGISAGQWFRLSDSAAVFPTFWAKVTDVAGTTVEVDRAFPCTYSGTINVSTYSALNGLCVIDRLICDGTNVTTSPGSSGQVLRIVGYEHVVIKDLLIKNFTPTTGAFVIHVENCIDVEIENIKTDDCSLADQIVFVDADGCRSVTIGGVQLHGGGFGLATFRSEITTYHANILSGRRKMEDDEAITARSIRGIKTLGCGYAELLANNISDYSSAYKIEQIHRFKLVGNTARNCGLFTYDGGAAVSITSSSQPEQPFGIIDTQLVEKCGAIGISVEPSGTSTDDVNTRISNSTIKTVGGHAIYCSQRKLQVSHCTFEDWNTTSQGAAGDNDTAAVYCVGGLICTNNTFENSDATDACIANSLVASQRYDFSNNAVLTANPLIAGSLVITKSATATILNGTTSIAVTHDLIKTPLANEILLSPTGSPTNDPGNIWLSSIGATQFTVNCRNDPGASNFAIQYRAHLAMPFTA